MDWASAVKGLPVIKPPKITLSVVSTDVATPVTTDVAPPVVTDMTTIEVPPEFTVGMEFDQYPALPYKKVEVDTNVPSIELETSTPEVVDFVEAWIFNNPDLLQSVTKVSDLHKSWRYFLTIYLSNLEGFAKYMNWLTKNNKLMGVFPEYTACQTGSAVQATTELEKKLRFISFQNCLWALSVGSKSLIFKISEGSETYKSGFLQIIKFKKYGDMAYVKWVITTEALSRYKRGARWEKNDYYDYCS